jgi:hypothetical protein
LGTKASGEQQQHAQSEEPKDLGIELCHVRG